MAADSTGAVVIGAGVVGLAVARELARSGLETLVLDRHRAPGQETSSRNSGVIHSGIYYPRDSLKASLCVRGRDLLYAYCEERGISHRRCGKLIVAQEPQVGALAALRQRGLENGVSDLEWLSAAEVAELEPAVRCAAALHSPSTGIIDVHEYLLALQADLEADGGVIAFDTQFLSAMPVAGGFHLVVRTGNEEAEFGCRMLVNCGGLSAPDNMRQIHALPEASQFRPYYAKGNYFSLTGARPFGRLVYPMPNEAGLGVHATLDLSGRVRFGPDVEWVDAPDYSVDPDRGRDFYGAVREYWPGLQEGALAADYAGVRPKLVGKGHSAADFVIQGSDAHGIEGLVNLLGIESPGLTASLAIAALAVGRAA